MTSKNPVGTSARAAQVLLIAVVVGAWPVHAQDIPSDAGVLDQPVPTARPGQPIDVEQLQSIVQEEQAELEELDRVTLETRAEAGERAAQVALGVDFAKEATLLAFAPDAANDALADAAFWYSMAASSGFPGAPSLDLAGVRFYPIRIQRERLPD